MSADVRVQGGSLDVSIISNTSTPFMIEASREMVAMHAMQAILQWPREELDVLHATMVLKKGSASLHESVADEAFNYAIAFEQRRWKG